MVLGHRFVTTVTHDGFLARNSQAKVTFSNFLACGLRIVGDICKCSLTIKIRRCLMDEVQDPTLSEEIDRLHSEHRRYAQRLEELLQKPYLSADEQLEEVRLKKLKLHAKDLIFALERRIPAIAYGFYLDRVCEAMGLGDVAGG